MTKKHFIAIADMLNGTIKEIEAETKENKTKTELETLNLVAEKLCDIFRVDNDRFDRGKFLERVYKNA